MNEFKVGLFAIISLLCVMYMSFKVTSSQSGFGNYKTYRVLLKDASGIFRKTAIKVAGIKKGRIKDIELIGEKALITFEILDDVQLKVNSILKIKSVGLLGDKFLEIYVGDHESLLQENAFIVSKEGIGIENILHDTSVILEDVKILVGTFKKFILPEDEESPLTFIWKESLALVTTLNALVNKIDTMVEGASDEIILVLENLKQFSDQLTFELDRDSPHSSANKIVNILKNVESSMGNIEFLIKHMKEGNGTVGKLLLEDDIANEVKKTLRGVNKIVNSIDAINTEFSLFLGKDIRGYSNINILMKIRSSPARFYVLGVGNSKVGLEQDISGNMFDSTEEEKPVERKQEKNKFLFDLQLGSTIQNWSYRGGLLNSTGSIGLDYKFQKVNAKLSLDLLEYQTNVGFNVRLSSEFKLWNIFYGKLVLNDTMVKSRSVVVSAGIKFKDEGLTGLLKFFF